MCMCACSACLITSCNVRACFGLRGLIHCFFSLYRREDDMSHSKWCSLFDGCSGYMYPGKTNVCQTVRNSEGRYLDMCATDTLICIHSKFCEKLFGHRICWFGGHFRELESPRVGSLAETVTFGGRKHPKSTQLIQCFPSGVFKNVHISSLLTPSNTKRLVRASA